MEKKIKLKPIVYTANAFKSGHQNTAQQMFLLDALKITQDPKKLKEMMGVKSVAEVYQTLDKLAMRKEYHSALASAGVSFDYIVNGIKTIAESGYKDGDRLKAFQTLLKSVGMEKYDTNGEVSAGTWEELLLKKIDEEKEKGSTIQEAIIVPEYAVIEPALPESARLAAKEEEEVSSTSIYDTRQK